MSDVVLGWDHVTFYIFEKPLVIKDHLHWIALVCAGWDAFRLFKLQLDQHEISLVSDAFPGEAKSLNTIVLWIIWPNNYIEALIVTIFKIDRSIVDQSEIFAFRGPLSLNRFLLEEPSRVFLISKSGCGFRKDHCWVKPNGHKTHLINVFDEWDRWLKIPHILIVLGTKKLIWFTIENDCHSVASV